MKLVRIEISNNAILGNLTLDFRDQFGNVYDTIILAGENGCGKTTILDIIARSNQRDDFKPNEKRQLFYYLSKEESDFIKRDFAISSDIAIMSMKSVFSADANGNVNYRTHLFSSHDFAGSSAISGYSYERVIYLTPEIQFEHKDIRNITSLETDTYDGGLLISNANSADKLVQLLIDIKNQDAVDFANKYENNPSADYDGEAIHPRIERFNKAFNYIIEGFSIKTVENRSGKKEVIILNKESLVPITKLSSGEKQLIFRGGFLLKDQNVLKEAIVLIDEPEISLHPNWQKKILRFYQNILKDGNGVQTSQLFVATHSPFVIHNEERINDKVFVLKKEDSGVVVLDKPEYVSYQSLACVEDAFNINYAKLDDLNVLLEGKTDESYFNKAIEVFDIKTNLSFKWIGYIDANGQERNTGKKALDHAFEFLKSTNNQSRIVLLYDCDANKETKRFNNIVSMSNPKYVSSKNMDIGIENALILDNAELDSFYSIKNQEKEYGGSVTIKELDKMKLCDYICGLTNEEAASILKNIKDIIESIDELFDKR